MKKIFVYGTLALSLSFAACDNVDFEDRFEDVEVNKSEKVVLLEDFTGQLCVNCPDAAKVINGLHEVYGDNFIAVAHHPKTNFQINVLWNDVSEEYRKKYNIMAFPTAIIDRTSFNGSVTSSNYNQWGGFVAEQMAKTTPVNIEIISTYNKDTRNIELVSNLSFSEDVKDALGYQLWVIENGIVGMQLSSNGMITDYEHNHILRDAVNGTWGEELKALGTAISFPANERVSLTHNYVLNEAWKEDNCQIVGFVYRKSDDVILQAHAVNVSTSETPSEE